MFYERKLFFWAGKRERIEKAKSFRESCQAPGTHGYCVFGVMLDAISAFCQSHYGVVLNC